MQLESPRVSGIDTVYESNSKRVGVKLTGAGSGRGRAVLFGLEPTAALAAAHNGFHEREEPVGVLYWRDRAYFVLQSGSVISRGLRSK